MARQKSSITTTQIQYRLSTNVLLNNHYHGLPVPKGKGPSKHPMLVILLCPNPSKQFYELVDIHGVIYNISENDLYEPSTTLQHSIKASSGKLTRVFVFSQRGVISVRE